MRPLLYCIILTSAAIPGLQAGTIVSTCVVNHAVTFPLPSTQFVTCPAVTAPVNDFIVAAALQMSGSWTDTVDNTPRTVQFTAEQLSPDILSAGALVINTPIGTTGGSAGPSTGPFGSVASLTFLSAYQVKIDTAVFSPDPTSASFTLSAVYATVSAPEPSTATLGGAAALGLLCWRRRRLGVASR